MIEEEDRCPMCGSLLEYDRVAGSWEECYKCLPPLIQKLWPTTNNAGHIAGTLGFIIQKSKLELPIRGAGQTDTLI
ncbi:MAG TPA: hypothetical protein ENF37_08315 [Beggiatoa sp.]|jgi:hypothetical protein|nr:hypothetical protein [Beggiatoa sp.]